MNKKMRILYKRGRKANFEIENLNVNFSKKCNKKIISTSMTRLTVKYLVLCGEKV